MRPPAQPSGALDPGSVQAAVDRRQAGGPFLDVPALGKRSLAALAGVRAALAGDSTFGVLAADLPNLPEVNENWYAASKVAARAGLGDPVGTAVSFLLAERSTSFAKDSPIALALAVAASESYGVAENGVADGSSGPVSSAARRLVATYAAPLRRFLDVQRQLSSELFPGTSYLSLFRGERRDEPAEAPATVALDLRPLSSWTTRAETARGMTDGPDAASGRSDTLVFSAEVPLDRLLSTWATGFGAALETELVLTGGRPGDCAAVITA